ncbi:MAG: hypothetical protein HY000_09495 [Planctomycetes bacterium]|nr:hypothetical protein [Planctomycetota bacterium]
MWWTLSRAAIAAVIIVAVSEVAQRLPRFGALLLTLPVVSIIAFVMTWHQHHDLLAISRLAKETLVLVPLGLPFFVPIAFADRWGLGFWAALVAGLGLASISIAAWFSFGPEMR